VRIPTPKQMAKLAALPLGTAVMNPRRHDFRPLLNHGWVEPVWDREGSFDCAYNPYGSGSYLPPLRITPHGLRALADAIEKYGQPEPELPQTQADARWFGHAHDLIEVPA
jgi:hypothetical protein